MKKWLKKILYLLILIPFLPVIFIFIIVTISMAPEDWASILLDFWNFSDHINGRKRKGA